MTDKMESASTIEQLGDTYVVTARGELDVFTAPALRLDLQRLAENSAVAVLVIDLFAVTFLDSSGLGALVGALRRLRERGGSLRIVRPQTPAARIFELTGLGEVLDLYPTRDAALSAEPG
jgi:anti-sigma B factor antagonist